MDTYVLQKAKELAVDVIRQAGSIAKERFGRVEFVQMKDRFGDLVTEVDHLSEAVILERIGREFPEHQIHSEEAGDNGRNSDWLWLIDPLDGTNNFAVGLPVFTTSITLMYRREPVLGVIYEAMTDRLFVSQVNGGAYCNNTLMRAKPCKDLNRGIIGWIQGHQVQHEPKAVKLRQHIDQRFKRMMRLWAPTLQWCMLAKGDIDGIVLYNSEGDDLYSGILMVKEAGGVVSDFEGKPYGGMKSEPYIIACHPDHQEAMLKIVNEGLGSAS